MSQHSKFSPSQLPRIVRCPGSVKATAGMKSTSSSYAQEGTMLHEVMEKALTLSQTVLSQDLIDEYNLNEEHINACNDCLDYIFVLMSQRESTPYMRIEVRVGLGGFADDLDCEDLHDVWGTLDLSISYPEERIIYFIDWKFGKGIEVFPDSEQLLTYGLSGLKTPEIMKNFDEVVLVIGQPRLYSGELFKELRISPLELYSWCTGTLVPALRDARSPHPKLCPSDKACQWCLNKTRCDARHAEALGTASEVFAAHANLPNKVTIEELCSLLAKARELNKYISDIEAFIKNRYASGQETPGWKLVEGRSIRRWETLDDDARPELFLDWAMENLGKDEYFFSILKPMSPTQAEKKLGRELASSEEFKAFVVKPKGKPTLVEESDKREPLKYQNAAETFADFT
jgi:hypothetical protein